MAFKEKTKNSGFVYQKRSREDFKKRANMKGGGFDSFIKPEYKTYKVRDGKNIIRILPATWEIDEGETGHYGYDLHVNYSIGADNAAYLSLSKMKGLPDPLADARREAEKEGDEKLAKALRPIARVGIWLIDRQDEDEGPQFWAVPFTVDKAFINLSMDEDTKEYVYVDDPEEGYDIRFYKEGQQLSTKYDASPHEAAWSFTPS